MNAIADDPGAARRDLANGISVPEHLGIIDFNGHFSVRLESGHLLINTGKSVRSHYDGGLCARWRERRNR